MNWKKLLPNIIGALIPIVTVIVLLTFVLYMTTIESGSMEPYIMTGDTAFFDRLAYLTRKIERGDVISFQSDEMGRSLVKRVIGIPGDAITFRDGDVFINGVCADERAYLSDEVYTFCLKSFTVPEGCVFVMGDNRENSFDSRHFNEPYIRMEKINGRFIGRVDFSIGYDIMKPLSSFRPFSSQPY